MYEIEHKSDFQTGATLVVRIPETDLDQKALYTILKDRPPFLLPFHYKVIDGQVAFTYQLGECNRLTYLSGSRSPDAYIKLWCDVLNPLLECDDWFMNPYAFVLQSEYLYCDKGAGGIYYVYIPSIKMQDSADTLKKMVTEIAKQNHVTDIQLENKVVWAIQEFQPASFLAMLKAFVPQGKETRSVEQRETPVFASAEQPSKNSMLKQEIATPKVTLPEQVISKEMPLGAELMQQDPDDIVIRFSEEAPAAKEKKAKGGLFGLKKDKGLGKEKNKEEKAQPKQKEPKEKKGFLGKKKEPVQEIVQGAAAEYQIITPQQPQYVVPIQSVEEKYDDPMTELENEECASIGLRYIGTGEHPRMIPVSLEIGAVFVIGRFDASIGVKQSDFEFDKKTKAVSRRHSVIERSSAGYHILDLSSSAGTFVDGQRLPPNTPFHLTYGTRVSFGYGGAEYVWEE